ncbi:MAG: hypothetical protein RIG62_27740 [Cyclobacteriaceae bacterium]
MVKQVWSGLLLLVLVGGCVSSKQSTPEQTEPLSFWINQEHIDGREGLRLSVVHAFTQPYLGIAVHDTSVVQQLSEGDALQIVLARGSRPVASSRETYEDPYRMGFDATQLLEKAKLGDRLVFASEAADQVLYTLLIIP